MFTKNRGARGTLRKTLILRFWTASITYTRQFGARAEKSWFLNPKCSGSLKIIKKWTGFLLNRLAMLLKTVSKTVIFRKILDGDPRKIAKCSLKIDIYEVLCEKHEFSCSERLRSHIRSNSKLELKNHDFWTKNVPDCSKSSKVNMLFTQSLP